MRRMLVTQELFAVRQNLPGSKGFSLSEPPLVTQDFRKVEPRFCHGRMKLTKQAFPHVQRATQQFL